MLALNPSEKGLRFTVSSRLSPYYESSAVGYDLVLRLRCADREVERGYVYGLQGLSAEPL